MKATPHLALLALLSLPLQAAPAPAPKPQAPARPTIDAPATLLSPYRISPRAGAQHVALDGEWRLGWRDAAIATPADLAAIDNWFPAQIPSTVQWALHRAGKFPHPYEHLNSRQYEWVDQKVWYYRRTFEPPARPDGALVFLCFDGIDYFARVWLNGALLGTHEGMFGGPDIEVGRLLHPGAPNEIVVEVRAGNHGNKAGWKPRGPEGAVVKPWVIAGGTGAEMFFPLGLWRGVRLEVVPAQHLERPSLATTRADDARADLDLALELFDGGHSLELSLHPWKNAQLVDASHGWAERRPGAAKVALRVRLAERPSGATALDRTFPLEIVAGRNFLKVPLSLERPKLWWPNGMGAPHLYRVELTLLRDGRPVDSLGFDHGIRTVTTRPSAGPRTSDRWADWQFEINGRQLFVKGMNWMPADILLDLPRARYEWLLELARKAGIQMLRIWGGGIPETDEFYETCDRLGLMVWQDFPIGNRDTPEWPQQVWEAQVLHTIFRLRNHPSLALWCGGNEFNPYSIGNAATVGILERCVADFDPARAFRRTSPDAGSIHTYPDMDPTWYGKLYGPVPYIAETGMHSIPDPASILEVVDPSEVASPLTGMFDKSFPQLHPELIHHFVEYIPARVPRMLSRASHIDDMRAPTLAALSEATQIGAGEFYQIVSDLAQANYPTTTGLMPWVFKRPWPVIAIMLVDGFGQPTAPYYFLKRTYEQDHILAPLPHLLWARGERLPLSIRALRAAPGRGEELVARVRVLDPAFAVACEGSTALTPGHGPSVTRADLGEFVIPDAFEDRFFFLVAELSERSGKLLSRSVYWPRCLSSLADPGAREKIRKSPQPFPNLETGPWLKPQVARLGTRIDLAVVGREDPAPDRTRLRARARNAGDHPAVMTRLDLRCARHALVASDNFLWLAPGEEREIDLEILWRDPGAKRDGALVASAWNAPATERPVPPAASPK